MCCNVQTFNLSWIIFTTLIDNTEVEICIYLHVVLQMLKFAITTFRFWINVRTFSVR